MCTDSVVFLGGGGGGVLYFIRKVYETKQDKIEQYEAVL